MTGVHRRLWTRPFTCEHNTMAELLGATQVKENRVLKCTFAVMGIMSSLLIYGILQEKIMRIPYGINKEYFRYSLFFVFCNCIMTSAVSAGVLLVWGTLIMQKKYNGKDYLFALLVTIGCAVFILYPTSSDITPYNTGRESTIWGISLMLGYLGFDGFTSTFQDKLFRGYDMEIHNQIFYTTICSCFLSLSGLILQGHLLSAIDFMFKHQDCFYDVALLSTVATASQFFISYTIRNFGALTFATIMTTRQLVSILLSCIWFAHPLSWEQMIGAGIVFGSIYTKSFLRSQTQRPQHTSSSTSNA